MANKQSKTWAALAAEAAQTAREAARQEAAHRQRLTSGTSTDREADAYMARQHGEDRRVAEANARDFQAMADTERKRWF